MSLLPAAGLEDHQDGTGNINAVVNGNWDTIESWADIAYGLTGSQTTTNLAASAPIFIADMVGASILYADGTVATITAFVDSQNVTVTPSQTVTSQAFKVYRTDQSPYSLFARSLTKVVRYTSSDDAKILAWDNTLGRYKLISRPGYGLTSGNILFGGGVGADATTSNDLNWDNTNKILAVNGGATFAGTFYGGVVAVAASTASTTLDGKLGNLFNVTLSSNTTIDMTNVKAGALYTIVLRQDGTGGRTVAWAAKFKLPNGASPNIYSAANAITVVYGETVTTSEINISAANDTSSVISARSASATPGATVAIAVNNAYEQVLETWTAGQDETVNISGTQKAGQILLLKITCDATSRQITLGTGFAHAEGSAGLVFKIKASKFVLLKFISDGTNFIECDGREVRGMVKPWSGSIASIPDAWILCDGSNGSPDLRNVFIAGANADVAGVAKSTITGAALQSGGSITHGHTITDPTHHHDLNDSTHYSSAGSGSGPTEVFNDASNWTTSDSATGITVDNTSTVQPFFALAYIFKL